MSVLIWRCRKCRRCRRQNMCHSWEISFGF
nr:MAG TPA_asm: Ribosomal L37ae protein family [Caudoviricetes sp.]